MNDVRDWDESKYIPEPKTGDAAAHRLAADRARERGDKRRVREHTKAAELLEAKDQVPHVETDRERYAKWACVGGSSENRGIPKNRSGF